MKRKKESEGVRKRRKGRKMKSDRGRWTGERKLEWENKVGSWRERRKIKN